MKTCSACDKTQPLRHFWIDRRRGGRMARCISCKGAANKEYRHKNRAKIRAADKKRYRANRVAERERHLVRKYGITLADYAAMLLRQGGGCAICGTPEPKGRGLDVDHDHKTGMVRGLLCTSCNRMLGHSGDSAEQLRLGAKYLSSRKSRRNS